jgi:electron transport complex protein RnfC
MILTKGARGGLRLEGHKARSTRAPIASAAAPAAAILALDQHAGDAAEPLVRIGERVLQGQPIAQPSSDLSAWLHAPISGHIVAIEPRPAAHRSGDASLSIVIANDGRDEPVVEKAVGDAFRSMEPLELREHIGRGGIVGLGGAVFPTAAKLASGAEAQAVRLLINGAECEPYISCDDMLMRERADDVVYGAQVLCRTLAATECVIAVEDDATQAEQALRAAVARVQDKSIRVAVVPSLYPAGGERQLIAAVFGCEVPFAGLPTDIGIVCQNVGTTAAIAHWVRDGEPLVRRIVTITGDGVQQPRNLDVRLGTPIAQLIAECGGYTPRHAQLLMGGTMMGLALPDDTLAIVKGTNCIIAASALDLQPRAPEMPCIRCGNCSEVCPALLLPQQLHLNARANDLDGLERYGLMDCIECGCCDYVCPSQIPLVERFREAKPTLAARLLARDNARDARLRYESRAARLQRLEAEQKQRLEEKRKQARKGASE